MNYFFYFSENVIYWLIALCITWSFLYYSICFSSIICIIFTHVWVNHEWLSIWRKFLAVSGIDTMLIRKSNVHNIDVSEKIMEYPSWHAHTYKNLPKTPTPHFISDILGWTCEDTFDHIEEQPLNLTTRNRFLEDRMTEPLQLRGDHPSRKCRSPRCDSPIKSHNPGTPKHLSRKNAAVKSKLNFYFSNLFSVFFK